MKSIYHILALSTLYALYAQQASYTKQIHECDSLAKHYLEINPLQSLYYAHIAHKESIVQTDSANIAYFATLIGVAHKRLGNYDSALFYYQKNLQINQKQKYSAGIAGAYNNIAFVYKLMAKYDLSIEYYLKALAENEKSNHIKNQITILNNIGNVFSDQNQFKEAMRYYKQSADLAIKYKYEESYAQAINNIGEIYFKQKKYDSAEAKFRESFAIKKKYNKPRMLATAYGNLSKVFYAKKEYDSAVRYAQKTLEAYTSYQDINGINAAKMHLASCVSELTKNHTIIDPKTTYWEVIKNASQRKDKNNLVHALYELSKYYAKEKEMDSAYFYLLQYIKYKDSIHNIEVSEKINELLTRYEAAQKQRSIDSLKHQNMLKENQRKQSELKTKMAMAGLSLFFVISASLLYLYHTKRKHHNEIKQKNAIIEQSLHHRELLIKEIHHRVKNNLQIISSLLNLQAHLSKNNIDELIKNSQDRIYAMSIIHEKLYQADNLEAIDFKDYIQKLMTYFEKSYELDKKQILLQTDIVPIKLDIDTLIPCGLIINELVTNSIKYAFEPHQKGIIKVWTEVKERKCTLFIKDNGKGLPKDFNPDQSKSLGSKLIKGFAQQLKAELNYYSEQGTLVSLSFNF
ncbi:MAG: tetratricopeptide repeat protein [Bacteroidia bacterium]|nr:tetratricopeptide repeat protein [Bacteroidia bacterium]